MRCPKPETLTLSDAERNGLEELVRRHSILQQITLQERIILAAAEGKNTTRLPERWESVSIRCAPGAGAGSACKWT